MCRQAEYDAHNILSLAEVTERALRPKHVVRHVCADGDLNHVAGQRRRTTTLENPQLSGSPTYSACSSRTHSLGLSAAFPHTIMQLRQRFSGVRMHSHSYVQPHSPLALMLNVCWRYRWNRTKNASHKDGCLKDVVGMYLLSYCLSLPALRLQQCAEPNAPPDLLAQHSARHTTPNQLHLLRRKLVVAYSGTMNVAT